MFNHTSLLASAPNVRWFRNRREAPTLRWLNKKKENIRTDQLIRHGEEKMTRRSEHLEW